MSIESALDKFEVQDSHIDALIMSGLHEYYKGEDPTISDTAKAILTQYSNVDEHELVTHIRDIVRQSRVDIGKSTKQSPA